MRRKEKEIRDRTQIDEIIRDASVCRLGMAPADGYPYIVPLCFGYDGTSLYFHSAKQGKKLDILRENKQVCIEFDIDQGIRKGKKMCQWGVKYRSVIGFGEASFVEGPEEKSRALDIIMRHYSADCSFEYPDTSLRNTVIIRVDIHEITGKASS